MILKIDHLSVGYQKVLAAEVSLALEKPSLVAVIGENGTGKSTFLKTLCGLQPALDGHVSLGSIKNIHSLTAKEIQQVIFYLPAGRIFSKELTVLELLHYSVNQSGNFNFQQPNAEDIDLSYLNSLNLNQLLYTPLGKLSDGQYQLIVIVFSLMRGASILLLDEPFSFLDYKNRMRVFKFLQKIVQEQKKTVLFTTHDLQFLKKVDEVWKLEDKRIFKLDEKERGQMMGAYLS